MSYSQVSIDSDLYPSARESVTAMSPYPSRCYTPDTPHSHDFEPCLGGQAHGQGAPVYSCGCYRRTKAKPALALAEALADVSEQDQRLERDVDNWITQVEGRSREIWPLKHKRSRSISESDSVGDITPRCFGQNLTNIQHAESVPALDHMPKRRKLEKAFESNGSTTHEASVSNVVKHLEAAIDRQTEVLSEIFRVLESLAK